MWVRGAHTLLALCSGTSAERGGGSPLGGRSPGVPLARVLAAVTGNALGSFRGAAVHADAFVACTMCGIRTCAGSCVAFAERFPVALAVARAAHTFGVGHLDVHGVGVVGSQFNFRAWMRDAVLAALRCALRTGGGDATLLAAVLAAGERAPFHDEHVPHAVLAAHAGALRDVLACLHEDEGGAAAADRSVGSALGAEIERAAERLEKLAERRGAPIEAPVASPQQSLRAEGECAALEQLLRGANECASSKLCGEWNIAIAVLEGVWGGVSAESAARKAVQWCANINARNGNNALTSTSGDDAANARCSVRLHTLVVGRARGWRALEDGLLRPALFAGGLVARALEGWSRVVDPNADPHTARSSGGAAPGAGAATTSLELEVALRRLLSFGQPIHVGDLSALFFDAAASAAPARARELVATSALSVGWLSAAHVQQKWSALLARETLSCKQCYGALQLVLLVARAARAIGDGAGGSGAGGAGGDDAAPSIALFEHASCAHVRPFQIARRAASECAASRATSRSTVITHMALYILARHPFALRRARALRARIAWLVLGAEARGYAGAYIVREWKRAARAVWGTGIADGAVAEAVSAGAVDRIAKSLSPQQWLAWELLCPPGAAEAPSGHPCVVHTHIAVNPSNDSERLRRHYDALLRSFCAQHFGGARRAFIEHLLPLIVRTVSGVASGAVPAACAVLCTAVSQCVRAAAAEGGGAHGAHWLLGLVRTVVRNDVCPGDASRDVFVQCIPPESLLLNADIGGISGSVDSGVDGGVDGGIKPALMPALMGVIRTLLAVETRDAAAAAAAAKTAGGERGSERIARALGVWCGSAAGGEQRGAGKRSRRGAPRVRGRPRVDAAGRDRIIPPASAIEPPTRERDSAYAALRDGLRDGLLLEIGLRALDAAIRALRAPTAVADAETLLRAVVAGGRSRSAVIAAVERLRVGLSLPMLSVCASVLACGDEEADGAEKDTESGAEGTPFELSPRAALSRVMRVPLGGSGGSGAAARRVSASNVFAILDDK